MRAPIAPDSRKLNPASLAVTPHPRNLEKNATTQMRMTYAQVIPLFNNPRFVRRPDRTKYYTTYYNAVVNRLRWYLPEARRV